MKDERRAAAKYQKRIRLRPPTRYVLDYGYTPSLNGTGREVQNVSASGTTPGQPVGHRLRLGCRSRTSGDAADRDDSGGVRAGLFGAHGVIGVGDTGAYQADSGLREIRVVGTAVVVDGTERPSSPRSCRLRGQRLAKLVEAGYWPVSALGVMSSVRSWAVCSTKMLMEGDYDELTNTVHRVRAGSPISQLADAHMQGRRLARDRLSAAAGSDVVFGGDLEVSRREVREGDIALDCVLRASRVTRGEHRKSPFPIPVLPLR